ncbi:MAG: hypothetical protein WCL32_10195, partial [Planctomycetota bacterium]
HRHFLALSVAVRMLPNYVLFEFMFLFRQNQSKGTNLSWRSPISQRVGELKAQPASTRFLMAASVGSAYTP